MPPLKPGGPSPRRGKRRIVSLPGVVKGVEMRSQLEVRFAEELSGAASRGAMSRSGSAPGTI